MRLFVLFIFLSLMITHGSVVFAAEDDSDFYNYTAMTKRLKADGIEVSQIRWPEIEQVCVSYLRSLDKVPYNRCRYEKAVMQTNFRDDVAACDDESIATYPDNWRQNSATVVQHSGATTSTTTVTTPSTSAGDLASMRRAVYERCMLDRGWRNARNYLRGRVEEQ